MIQKARFQNFKSLRDVTIEFDSRLTVLVGPNGSGKTSVLEGLQFSLNLSRQAVAGSQFNLDRLPGYASAWTAWEEMRLEVVGRRGRGTYRVELGRPTPQQWPGIVAVSVDESQRSSTFYGHRGGGGVSVQQHPEGEFSIDESGAMDHTALFRLSPSKLALPTLTPANKYPPTIEADGTGLAASLVYIQRKYPAQFDAVVSAFRNVIPSVRGLRFDEAPAAGGGQYLAPIVLVDYVGAQGIPANHLSSGTLFALGLLTIALGPDSPNVLLVDELDHGLHPKAQSELIGVFQRLVDTNPDLQIIGTTHSLYMLHHLQSSQIRLMNIQPDGSATCGRLESHPDYERWKDDMTPGEFWGHVGEDWLLKKPAPEVAA